MKLGLVRCSRRAARLKASPLTTTLQLIDCRGKVWPASLHKDPYEVLCYRRWWRGRESHHSAPVSYLNHSIRGFKTTIRFWKDLVKPLIAVPCCSSMFMLNWYECGTPQVWNETLIETCKMVGEGRNCTNHPRKLQKVETFENQEEKKRSQPVNHNLNIN